MRRSRILVPAASLFLLFSPFELHAAAQRPSERYRAAIEHGMLEPRVRSFVSGCLHVAVLPAPIGLYSQGAWFVTPDLALHIKQEGSDDDGTAQVWERNGKPRAVSMWVHDDEFDRYTLACLNDTGMVLRQVNGYMPGLSEPDLHWISLHRFTVNTQGKRVLESAGFTGWDGQAIAKPRLTSEDRDFIAGEREYVRWNDFDFVTALERNEQP